MNTVLALLITYLITDLRNHNLFSFPRLRSKAQCRLQSDGVVWCASVASSAQPPLGQRYASHSCKRRDEPFTASTKPQNGKVSDSLQNPGEFTARDLVATKQGEEESEYRTLRAFVMGTETLLTMNGSFLLLFPACKWEVVQQGRHEVMTCQMFSCSR